MLKNSGSDMLPSQLQVSHTKATAPSSHWLWISVVPGGHNHQRHSLPLGALSSPHQ